MLVLVEEAEEVAGDCVIGEPEIGKSGLYVGVEMLIGVVGLDLHRWCLLTRSRSR